MIIVVLLLIVAYSVGRTQFVEEFIKGYKGKTQ
jgi:hypothetical protein